MRQIAKLKCEKLEKNQVSAPEFDFYYYFCGK